MPTVYVVRHGSTDYNSGESKAGKVTEEKFRGHKDIPLNADGRAEAQRVAKLMAPLGIKEIYSSDLSRAADTAKAIQKATGAELEISKDLRPWDLGKLTGTPVKEGLAELKQYASKTPSKPLPGGESFDTFRDRFLTELDGILKEAAQEGPFVVVTHTRGTQLIKASHAVPGGLANHTIDPRVFDDYSKQVHTGEVLKLVYDGKGWGIASQGEAKVMSKGASTMNRTQV